MLLIRAWWSSLVVWSPGGFRESVASSPVAVVGIKVTNGPCLGTCSSAEGVVVSTSLRPMVVRWSGETT